MEADVITCILNIGANREGLCLDLPVGFTTDRFKAVDLI